MTRARGRPAHDDELTPAEWAVVKWVRHGRTNPQIAERRGIGVDAVKFHVSNALAKLGLADRRQLRRWNGVRRGSALTKNEGMRMDAIALCPVGQVSRTVADLDQSVRFYGETRGLPHLYTFGELAFFDCDGMRLYLHQTRQCPNRASTSASPTSTRRTGSSMRGASSFSARRIWSIGIADGTEEWMPFFKDPEGRTLALMAQSPPG